MIKIRFFGDWAPLGRDIKECNFDNFIFLNIEGPIIKNNKKYSLT